MMFRHYVRRAFSLPPHVAVAKALQIFRRFLRPHIRHARQKLRPSFSRLGGGQRLVLNFQSLEISMTPEQRDGLQRTAKMALDTCFDLLGSGWVRVAHGAACKGVEGHRYPPEQEPVFDPQGDWLKRRVNRSNAAGSIGRWRLIDGDHRAIDWQLDFKSGYRWSEKSWGHATPVAPRPGVDIKVPWELGRLQYLPQFAIAHAAAARGDTGFAAAEIHARGFRNQVLDFLAANPPGWGVNWHCTMDVAIRITNILLAWNIFRASGGQFDDAFEAVLHAAAVEHGEHIAANLEWAARGRGNHYLCNVVGLIFAAAYLPSGRQSDRWLAYGYRALLAEVGRQFHGDGGNFEASICYHRLSGEAVAYATALVLGLPEERLAGVFRVPHAEIQRLPGAAPTPPDVTVAKPIPDWYARRLARIAEFSRAAIRPDGGIAQFGDNDNGRIVKLLAEDALDHRGLAVDIAALFDGGRQPVTPSAAVLRGLAGSRRLRRIEMPARKTDVPFVNFPDFGLFVWRRERVWLALRCGPNGQDGLGGHAHNDQLSIEFCADGKAFVVDPGTYLYTGSEVWRNRFRATGVHNTLTLTGREQNDWLPGAQGLFLLVDQANAVPLRHDENSFSGEHFGFGASHKRDVTISDLRCDFQDFCGTAAAKQIGLTLHPDVQLVPTPDAGKSVLRRGNTTVEFVCDGHRIETEDAWYSPGYGQKIATHRLVVRTGDASLKWSLSVL